MNIRDIECTESRARTKNRNSDYSNVDYRDVTAKNWETKRTVNPIVPEY